MRYISAQFIEYLSNDLWLKNATHANEMAKILEKEIRKIDKKNHSTSRSKWNFCHCA